MCSHCCSYSTETALVIIHDSALCTNRLKNTPRHATTNATNLRHVRLENDSNITVETQVASQLLAELRQFQVALFIACPPEDVINRTEFRATCSGTRVPQKTKNNTRKRRRWTSAVLQKYCWRQSGLLRDGRHRPRRVRAGFSDSQCRETD